MVFVAVLIESTVSSICIASGNRKSERIDRPAWYSDTIRASMILLWLKYYLSQILDLQLQCPFHLVAVLFECRALFHYAAIISLLRRCYLSLEDWFKNWETSLLVGYFIRSISVLIWKPAEQYDDTAWGMGTTLISCHLIRRSFAGHLIANAFVCCCDITWKLFDF